MNRARRRARAVVGAAVLVTLLTACDGSSMGRGPQSPGPRSGPSASGAVTASAARSTPGSAGRSAGATPRTALRVGGQITWALTSSIGDFNPFDRTGHARGAVLLDALLPRPFDVTVAGTRTVDTDYFTSVAQISNSPQTIEYEINPKARWSDGSSLSYLDFRGLWTAARSYPAFGAPNGADYRRIASIARGADARDVVVRMSEGVSDWQSLFDPLVPSSLTATATTFRTGWADHPVVTAGPFRWGSRNPVAGTYTINRDPRWWGPRALLDSITFATYRRTAEAIRGLGSHQVDVVDVTGADVSAVQPNTAAVLHSGGTNPRALAVTSTLRNLRPNRFDSYSYADIGFVS